MKTFKITYTKSEIKAVEEISNIQLFNRLMFDIYLHKETLESEPMNNVISCHDKFGNYIYIMTDTIEQAYNYVKKEILEK
ncbi:MAG: hypothetical protein SPF22_01125 [Candidatus Onthovivens sp.]|nr:hypothetical protein [Candidatus Onthovivens sp.]